MNHYTMITEEWAIRSCRASKFTTRWERNEMIQDQMTCDGLSWQLGFQYTNQQQSPTSSDGFSDHVGSASQRVEQNKNELVWMAFWGTYTADFFSMWTLFLFSFRYQRASLLVLSSAPQRKLYNSHLQSNKLFFSYPESRKRRFSCKFDESPISKSLRSFLKRRFQRKPWVLDAIPILFPTHTVLPTTAMPLRAELSTKGYHP